MIEVRKTVYSNDELFTDMEAFSGKNKQIKSEQLFYDWKKKINMLDKSKVEIARIEMNRISRGKITFLRLYDLFSGTEKKQLEIKQ